MNRPSFIYNLIAVGYKPMMILKNFLNYTGITTSRSLRILIYHDIPNSKQHIFKEKIKWLKRRWKFITPNQFEDMMSGKLPIEGKNLLLSFDDGFKSNYRIADEVLNPMRIKALFSIPTDYINDYSFRSKSPIDINNFFPNIRYKNSIKKLQFMNLAELKKLLDWGHLIATHTKSHTKLSEVEEKDVLHSEIVHGADMLESILKIDIKYFAIPFGKLCDINPIAMNIAAERFRFVFTSLGGDNSIKRPCLAIRRHPDSLDYPKRYTNAVLCGMTDIRYRKETNILDEWLEENDTQFV